jgi:type II secretory pathway component PulF
MANYFYIARDRIGNKVNGAEEGANQDEVINRLQARAL